MNRRLLLSVILSLSLSPAALSQDDAPVNKFGYSKPMPRPRGTIRLASYNLLNLFDHADDPALEGEFDDMNEPTPHERCLKLAEAIRAMDADVIALQEIESLAALTWFRDTYLAGMGYEHLASMDVGYYRGIECSVMSRFEITAAKVWPNASIADVEYHGIGWAELPAEPELTFQRSPIMVDLRTPYGYEFTLFSIHHKAGGASYSYKREAEALTIMRIIAERQADDLDRNIAVMGDFNAAPWDKSFRVYLEGGLIDTLSHRNTRGVEAPLYKTHESSRVLDYVLLNSQMHNEFVVGSAHVYGTLTPPSSYNWRTDPDPPGYASDHYPVIIDITPRDR